MAEEAPPVVEQESIPVGDADLNATIGAEGERQQTPGTTIVVDMIAEGAAPGTTIGVPANDPDQGTSGSVPAVSGMHAEPSGVLSSADSNLLEQNEDHIIYANDTVVMEEGGATSSSQKNGTQFGGLRVVGGETNELRLGSGFVPDQHSARFASEDGLGSTANQHHGTRDEDWRRKLSRTSFAEQRLTHSCQLRIDMTQSARTMGVKRLYSHQTADTVLYQYEGIDKAMKKFKKPKRYAAPPLRMTNAFDLRVKAANKFKANYAQRKIDEETILKSQPPPEDIDEMIVATTKTSAMRTGLNFPDLSVSLKSLRWATPPNAPTKKNARAKDPFTVLNLKPEKRFGRGKGMGIGTRFPPRPESDTPAPGDYGCDPCRINVAIPLAADFFPARSRPVSADRYVIRPLPAAENPTPPAWSMRSRIDGAIPKPGGVSPGPTRYAPLTEFQALTNNPTLVRIYSDHKGRVKAQSWSK